MCIESTFIITCFSADSSWMFETTTIVCKLIDQKRCFSRRQWNEFWWSVFPDASLPNHVTNCFCCLFLSPCYSIGKTLCVGLWKLSRKIRNIQIFYSKSISAISETLCAIWYHLHSLKKRQKHPQRSLTFSKVAGFLNCTNGTKSRKGSRSSKESIRNR